jgi:lauroyl/myristoyl acyltransferase
MHGTLRLGRWLTPAQAMDFGQLVGSLCGFTGLVRRRLAANWRAAGIPFSGDSLDRYFQRLGIWAGWSLAVYHHGIEKSGVFDRVEFTPESLQRFDELRARGRGVILAAPHNFGHELLCACLSRRHPIAAVVRESKSASHSDIKQRWYGALGLQIIHRARRSSALADAAALLRVLRSGGVMGITPDVLMPAQKGMPVQMFGRTVSLAPGFAFLAQRCGAAVLTQRWEWLGRATPREARVRIHFSDPIVIPANSNPDAVSAALQGWCSHHEAQLRQDPANWMFWLDKSWTRLLQRSVA